LLAILAAHWYFNAYAGIAILNQASVALCESMGFETNDVYRGVGYTLGRWSRRG
jgi:phosphinothricin acetyltransferase